MRGNKYSLISNNIKQSLRSNSNRKMEALTSLKAREASAREKNGDI